MNFEEIVDLAVNKKASDVHFSSNLPVFLRVHGTLAPLENVVFNNQNIQDFLVKILRPEQQQTLQKERQVDFLAIAKNNVRLRGNAFFQNNGLAAAFRIIPNQIPDLFDLGFPQFFYDKVLNIKRGFVLFVGATGEGKSTTLAAILKKRLQNKAEHIITVEDPIEYIIPPGKGIIQQRELLHDVNHFRDGIKSALREDPDTMMVGEMRNLETISSALTMAETGHLVFSTLHTNSGPETINRIIDVFPGDQQSQIRSQLATALTMIVAQKLIPVNNGTSRVLAYEILTSNYAIKNYIRQNKIFQIPNAQQTDSSGTMVIIEQSLAGLVQAGKITKEIAFNYCHDSEQLKSIFDINGI